MIVDSSANNFSVSLHSMNLNLRPEGFERESETDRQTDEQKQTKRERGGVTSEIEIQKKTMHLYIDTNRNLEASKQRYKIFEDMRADTKSTPC